MRSRSFHPVMAVITFIVALLGLLSGCASNPVGTEPTITSNSVEEIDTSEVMDSGELADQEMIERLDYWIQQMDQYVSVNNDWTYSFDQSDFLENIAAIHPDVYDHYVNDGVATDDTEVIDDLVDGLPIVNQYALEQYNELTANGTIASPPSTWRTWYWWGYKQCFSGSNADTAEAQICYGSIVTTIGWAIPGAYLAACCYKADSCNDAYGQFCVNWTWTLSWVWVSCS